MKVLPILVLLSSVAQLCSATPVEPVTCSEDNAATAAHFAMHHINMHHHHGYKFRLSEIQGNKTEKVDDGCNIELQLDLLETKCHTVNPKPFEDCDLRSMSDRAVIANCTVMISVKNSDAKVTEYNCDTRQVLTNREMASICPDCPILIALNDTNGLRAVDSIVKTFNKNTSNQHYYILHEVGRILTGYMPASGMMYYPQAVLVETRCPMGSRIAIEACKPLCPDRALSLPLFSLKSIMHSAVHPLTVWAYLGIWIVNSILQRTLLPLALMRGSLYVSLIIIMGDILILLALLGMQTEEDPLPMLTVMIMIMVKNVVMDPLPMLAVMDPLPMLAVMAPLPVPMVPMVPMVLPAMEY
ncbi:Alpha-2-HS-glycoprotein Asialofetuin [Collichthys lucidus]|uniref:Alpha-2-HS-glycoprotein Asialofetuin n=1 Tax=Collichthys lucidus TaxID=240159 RepID=A0A4U5UL47_COLLU|nr:Alpha-2-HS-glycoprotein Asialofetuin [Collichthys lucidus]